MHCSTDTTMVLHVLLLEDKFLLQKEKEKAGREN